MDAVVSCHTLNFTVEMGCGGETADPVLRGGHDGLAGCAHYRVPGSGTPTGLAAG